MPKIESKTETRKVTPTMCIKWLEHNEHNRPLSQKHIDTLTRTMIKGDWELNGESLKFDLDENVIDGQHRMWACIQAKKPFTTFITTGLSADIFDTIDTGKSRNAPDILGIKKEKNVHLLAATLKHIGRYYDSNMLGGLSMTNKEVEELLAQHFLVRNYVKKVAGMHRPKWCAPTVFATCWYITGIRNKYKADEFFESLILGTNMLPGSPILMLRNKFIDIQSSTVNKLSSTQKIEMIAIVWNMWLKGKTAKHLRLTALASSSKEFTSFNK